MLLLLTVLFLPQLVVGGGRLGAEDYEVCGLLRSDRPKLNFLPGQSNVLGLGYSGIGTPDRSEDYDGHRQRDVRGYRRYKNRRANKDKEAKRRTSEPNEEGLDLGEGESYEDLEDSPVTAGDRELPHGRPSYEVDMSGQLSDPGGWEVLSDVLAGEVARVLVKRRRRRRESREEEEHFLGGLKNPFNWLSRVRVKSKPHKVTSKRPPSWRRGSTEGAGGRAEPVSPGPEGEPLEFSPDTVETEPKVPTTSRPTTAGTTQESVEAIIKLLTSKSSLSSAFWSTVASEAPPWSSSEAAQLSTHSIKDVDVLVNGQPTESRPRSTSARSSTSAATRRASALQSSRLFSTRKSPLPSRS